MKLFQKGIAIAAIPLIFELVLVSTLAIELNALEAERATAAKGRDMVASLSAWSRSMADAAIFLVTARYHESPKEERQFRESVKSMANLADRLGKDAESLPKVRTEVAALKGDSDKIVAQLNWLLHSGDVQDGNTVFSGNLDMRNELEPQIVGFIRSCDRVSGHVKELTGSESGTSLGYIWQWLTANLVGSILTSIIVAWFVFGNLVNRIIDITRQTRLFKESRQLPPPGKLKGTDEISQLEGEFLDMAKTVNEAAVRREQFTSMISHDLRSPLSAVKITLSLTKAGKYGNLDEAGLSRLDKAEQSIERLIGLINQLLDAEKLEAGLFRLKMEQCGLMEVLYPAVESVRALAEEKQVELIFKCDDHTISADRERLSQVVQNLLANAVKFTPKWGKITIKSDVSDDFYMVSVIDTGPGIPEDYQAKIFDRFEQLPEDVVPSKGGSGLGLAICKGIVQAHGGEIGVDSVEGKGSTFWFTLPKVKV